MDSKIIFLGIARRAWRGVFERGGVWELFRVFRGNIWFRRDADPPSSRARRGQSFTQSEFAEKFDIVRSSTIASWSSPAAMSKYSTSSAGT